jgi:hypothetical protein
LTYDVRRRPVSTVSLGSVAIAALLFVAVYTGATPSIGASASTAQTECDAAMRGDAAEYGSITGIRQAERDDVATIASWQEERLAADGFESPLRKEDVSRVWTVCAYAGTFVTPTTPNEDGSVARPHDTLVVFLTDDGEMILDSAGYADRMFRMTPRTAK